MIATFTPSKYQQAILDWIPTPQGSRHAMVIARAGSGKTKTLELAFTEIKEYGLGSVTTLAFNTAIAGELKRRLGDEANVSTINAKGHSIVSKYLAQQGVKVKLEKFKYYNFFDEYFKDMLDPRYLRDVKACAINLLSKSMAELADSSVAGFELVSSHYGIEVPNGIDAAGFYAAVKAAMVWGSDMAAKGIITFDDQIWLPAAWELSDYAYKSDWVLVDEAQDLSKAKLALAMMCCDLDGSGRMIFVGDDKQAIYGFAGASADSIPNIVKATEAKVFPLPISYRCSAAVIRAAQKIVPDIEARENAPEGAVNRIPEAKLTEALVPGSLVVCRLTAPLVTLCISLLSQRVAAKVRGKDIGRDIVKMASEALQQAPWSAFGTRLHQYVETKVAALATLKNSQSKISALYDRKDAIEAIVAGYNCTSLYDFGQAIERLFADEASTITLATIHRVKGEEAENVFIVRPDKLPLTWEDQQEWEAQQESNLHYVAITRAITNLTYVMPMGQGHGETYQ